VDQENLGEEWGPSVGFLSREEMDKRDGNRERQIRRLRRETARFGTGASLLPEDWERKRGRARRSPSPSRNNSGRGTPLAGVGTSGPMALAVGKSRSGDANGVRYQELAHGLSLKDPTVQR